MVELSRWMAEARPSQNLQSTGRLKICNSRIRRKCFVCILRRRAEGKFGTSDWMKYHLVRNGPGYRYSEAFEENSYLGQPFHLSLSEPLGSNWLVCVPSFEGSMAPLHASLLLLSTSSHALLSAFAPCLDPPDYEFPIILLLGCMSNDLSNYKGLVQVTQSERAAP